MEMQEYLRQKKELYDSIIEFLDSESDEYFNSYGTLMNDFNKFKQEKDPEEIKSLLRLLVQISHHHHANAFFNKKIEKILNYFSSTLNKILTNSDIFNIVKSNRKILLFLLKSEIILLDKQVLDFILSNAIYRHFFYPEIKSHITKKEEQKINKKLIPDDFESKRQKGENDSYICDLIRNDSIEDFISHVNRNFIQISTAKIKQSLFEMNPLLNEREPTLIEYAAFFGSIQIFRYLFQNNIELTSSLWIYSIHSNRDELIYFLIENQVKPPNDSYEKCLIEAIKCHHNNIAQYILINFCSEIKASTDLKDECILRYYNYSFISENINQQFEFFYLCKYQYNKIVNFIIQMRKDEFESKLILKIIFSFIMEFLLFIYKDEIYIHYFMKMFYIKKQ